MGAEEPNENAKCMDIESEVTRNGDSNGIGRWKLPNIRKAPIEEKRRCLLILFAILSFVFFLIIIVLAFKVNTASTDLHGRCYSPECLRSAAHIISNMDLKQDPCQDFQQFACGGFLSQHLLNSSVTRVDLLDEAREQIRRRTKQIIDAVSPDEENSPTTVASHIAKFLQSCLDERSLSSTPNTNILTVMRQIGGWEALSATSYDRSSWKFDQTLLSLMKDYAVFPYFKVEVATDGRGSRTPMIKISPSGSGLGGIIENYYAEKKPRMRLQYMKFISTVIDELRDRNKDATPEDLSSTLYFYELRLLQASVRPFPRNLSHEHVHSTLGELRNHAPNIIWRNILESLFPGIVFTDNYRILLEDEKYFKNLANVLSSTSENLKNNYMMWHFVMKYAPFMSKGIRLAEAKFRAEMAGGHLDKLDYKDTFTSCLDHTVEYFGLGLAHIFREKFHGQDSMKTAERLFAKIGQIARKNVENVDWLRDARSSASDRLENIAFKVGYPDVADSDARVLAYYKEGQTNRHFLDNIMEQNRVRMKWMAYVMDQRKERQDRSRVDIAKGLMPWVASPLDIIPKYSYDLNQVTVPLGFLFDPIFSAGQNQALQLAALVRVAQEAMKAVDGFGLQFRDFGVTPNSTFNALKSKFDCISVETDREVSSSGEVLNKFVEEAVSDIAGLRVALEAFEQAGHIPKLPGLEYEPKQLFYIGYGQLMCARMTNTRMSQLNATLETAPERLRLHRSLQQTPDFADTFGCRSSNEMVAAKVCNVW